jgi:hypothetical protein
MTDDRDERRRSERGTNGVWFGRQPVKRRQIAGGGALLGSKNKPGVNRDLERGAERGPRGVC